MGNAYAMYSLGECYNNGEGVPKDGKRIWDVIPITTLYLGKQTDNSIGTNIETECIPVIIITVVYGKNCTILL